MAEPLLSSDSSFARVSDASSPRLSSRVALAMVSIAVIAVAGFVIALVFLIGNSVDAEPIVCFVWLCFVFFLALSSCLCRWSLDVYVVACLGYEFVRPASSELLSTCFLFLLFFFPSLVLCRQQ